MRLPMLLAAGLALAAAWSSAEDYPPVSLAWAGERTAEGLPAHAGEAVRVRGTVTVDSDAYFDDLLKTYVEDGPAGLCLFSRQRQAPLRVGDVVEAEGTVQGFMGTVQLRTNRISVVGRTEPPAPLEVAPARLLSPELSGRLVETTSTVVGTAAQNAGALNVSLAAGDGLLVVHLTRKQARALGEGVFAQGATVRVRGIASQFDRRAPFDAGWQILPRSAADLAVVRAPPLFTGRDLGWAAAAAGVLLALVGAWNVALRREVRRRTEQYRQTAESLEQVNRGLREAMRIKEEVVFIVAHDFRAPLTLIQGYSESLQARVGDEEARRGLRIIYKHAKQLAELAADTLTMSRIEAGALPLERRPLALDDLVKTLVQARQAEWGVAIGLELPAQAVLVEADRERLQQVVDNLLENAVKYSPEGPHVSVSVRATAHGAEVSVADEGLAIAPADMPRLFQRFSRLEAAREHKIPGTGLGLYICRSIVEAHGGRIWAQSGDRGATFSFELPSAGALSATA